MAKDVNAIIGVNIRRMRERRKLSLKKLSDGLRADGIIISPRRLSRMEKGLCVIYACDLSALADFLGCTVEMLAEGTRTL